MYENLIKFPIPYDTPEWHLFRTTGIPAYGGMPAYAGGIGASESGKILGLDKYRPSLPELFAHKVGMYPVPVVENIPMERGIYLEDSLAELWCHWNGNSKEEIIKAYQRCRAKEQMLRQNVKVNCYMVNPKYPWLFVSLDRAIPAGQKKFDGTILIKPAPLELKTIGLFQAEQYEFRLPPKYTCQVMQQMIVTESDYGEIFMWEDGALRCYQFGWDQGLVDAILNRTYDYWQNVLHARELYKMLPQYANDQLATNEIWGRIQRLEPEPDHTEAYTQYMTEKMTRVVPEVKGTATDYINARRYIRINALLEQLNMIKTLCKNKLIKSLQESQAEKINFGREVGTVKFGSQFRVNIKDKNLDQVEEQAKQLIQTIK